MYIKDCEGWWLWHITGCTSQVSWVRLLVAVGLSLPSILASKHLKFSLFQLDARVLNML